MSMTRTISMARTMFMPKSRARTMTISRTRARTALCLGLCLRQRPRLGLGPYLGLHLSC